MWEGGYPLTKEIKQKILTYNDKWPKSLKGFRPCPKELGQRMNFLENERFIGRKFNFVGLMGMILLGRSYQSYCCM